MFEQEDQDGAAPALARDEYKSLEQIVYQRLFEQIVTHALPAGSRLVLDDIASELGVSRTPVRDAVRRLESDGLVTGSPRSGFHVMRNREEDVQYMYDLRLALELFIVEFAIQRKDEPDYAELRLSAANWHTRTNDAIFGSPPDLSDAVSALHEWFVAFTSLAGNPLITEAYLRRHLSLTMFAVRVRQPREVARRELADNYAEVVNILDALERKDLEAAREAMTSHNVNRRERVLRALRELGGIED